MEAKAIGNIKAIASLIEEQQISIKFYDEKKFDKSAPVVLFSQGRSIFKNALPLPLKSVTGGIDSNHIPEEEMLEKLRAYLIHIRTRVDEYEIPTEVSEHIQDVFIKRRAEHKDAENPIGAQDLHRWMTLAKLKSISHGAFSLTKDTVDYVLQMEDARQGRVKEI